MSVVDEAKLGYLDFLSREDRVRHHRYVEEMKQYDMMRSGDINAISEMSPDGIIRRHHEIYLNDPRRVAPEKMKTVVRHPIRK